MRYSRYEFTGIGSRRLRRRIFIGIIAVLIIAIVPGYLISNWIPAGKVLDSTGREEAPKYKYVKPDSRNYYTLQTGAFSSFTNAESFAANMRKKGIPAYEYKEGNLTVVLNYVHKDKKTAEETSIQLKSKGIEYLIKEFAVSPDVLPQELINDNRYVLLSKLINDIGRLLDRGIETGAGSAAGDNGGVLGSETIEGIKNTISDDTVKLDDLQESAGMLQDEITKQLDSITGKLLDINEGQVSQPQYEELMIELFVSYRNLVENFNSVVSVK